MRRWLGGLFLCFALLIFLPIGSVHGDTDFSISIEKEIDTPVPGGNFTVEVSIFGNPGLKALGLKMIYPSDAMTLRSVTLEDSLLSDAEVELERSGDQVELIFSDTWSENGLIMTLNFRLSESVQLHKNYTISAKLDGVGAVDADGTQRKPTIIAGSVELDCFHEYNATVIKPTCSSEGYTEYHCPKCNRRYIGDFVAKTSHNWKVQSSTKATCTRAGTQTVVCKECNAKEIWETSSALGHDHQVSVVVEPTCSRGGYTIFACTRCGDSYQDLITPMVDHRYSKTYSKAPTCTETGFDLYACEFCGMSYQMTLPSIEHNWGVQVMESTHDHGGWSLYTCAVCGISMRGSFTDPCPYEYVYHIEREATCTHTGLKIGVCADGCGMTVEEEIPMTEHCYGEWECVRKATLTREGLWRAVCGSCGVITESATPKLIGTSENTSKIPFWKAVCRRILDSTVHTAVVVGILALLFLLILSVLVRKAMKRRQGRLPDELEILADQMEDLPPLDTLPENAGEEFCHDYEDFGLPSPEVMAKARRMAEETDRASKSSRM